MITRPDEFRQIDRKLPTLVVAAIIVDDLAHPTRVLAAQRMRPDTLAGLWEFPGGKVEPNESPRRALAREIFEELGTIIEVGDQLPHPSGAWPISSKFEMFLYFSAIVDGEPTAGDSHSELRWVTEETIASIHWLPADADAIEKIRARLQ
ncbi:(deoxy)nucleoside triphosphate pyrophosphohydrolase [Tsukamurella paurometabola]|uniref:(deoxy)nucleoside triphosphate pyrophosphohydrolase n=1 Tax=Tsukamurella paurometabola TaxID=2061 RepID=UPI000F7D73EB|nr:(deoxy)nucleoside triphosphate pyrophosphohydrolase [Tsukamurella paurometabola]UEA84210.1 (deoxy)nucleoside triphosphate pyrophosphohydrolase [Tsukamurella paurometabola]